MHFRGPCKGIHESTHPHALLSPRVFHLQRVEYLVCLDHLDHPRNCWVFLADLPGPGAWPAWSRLRPSEVRPACQALAGTPPAPHRSTSAFNCSATHRRDLHGRVERLAMVRRGARARSAGAPRAIAPPRSDSIQLLFGAQLAQLLAQLRAGQRVAVAMSVGMLEVGVVKFVRAMDAGQSSSVVGIDDAPGHQAIQPELLQAVGADQLLPVQPPVCGGLRWSKPGRSSCSR